MSVVVLCNTHPLRKIITKTELINMDELSKADWQKILTNANQSYHSNMMGAAISKSAIDTAREHLKILYDDETKGRPK